MYAHISGGLLCNAIFAVYLEIVMNKGKTVATALFPRFLCVSNAKHCCVLASNKLQIQKSIFQLDFADHISLFQIGL